MAQGLNDSDVSVRLQALDAWVQQGAQAPLDPLIVALDDEDDAVSDKAMAIIEWQWEAWQEAKPQTVK
jgi:HEAT repeat protein